MHLGTPHIHFRELDSTNLRAAELAQQAAIPHGTVISAGHQTAGRGRHGRSWFSQPDKSLLFSLVLRKFDQLLSLRAGLAVAEAIGVEAMVKWPNDVIVCDRKVAGVLVQTQPQSSWAVLGIGVNLGLAQSDFPPELRGRADTIDRGRNQLLGAILEQLVTTLELRPNELIGLFDQRDWLKHKQVNCDKLSGIAAGIAPSGALMLIQSDGHELLVRSGEVDTTRVRSTTT